MSLPEFREQYVEHTKITRKMPGIVKYVASTALQGVHGGEPPFDAVAEIWWESMDAIRAAFLGTTWNASRTEHTTFLSGRFMFECEERDIRRPPSDRNMVKYMAFLNRKDAMSVEDFRRYWLDVHVPLALETPHLLGYRASPTMFSANGDSLLKAIPDSAPFDGVAEMWFDDLESFESAFRDKHWEKLRLDYYGNFAQGLMQVLVKENLLLDHMNKGGGADGGA
jgi:uncharacterized protein (TIGR02118 family)